MVTFRVVSIFEVFLFRNEKWKESKYVIVRGLLVRGVGMFFELLRKPLKIPSTYLSAFLGTGYRTPKPAGYVFSEKAFWMNFENRLSQHAAGGGVIVRANFVDVTLTSDFRCRKTFGGDTYAFNVPICINFLFSSKFLPRLKSIKNYCPQCPRTNVAIERETKLS